jgi:hypothetical protein
MQSDSPNQLFLAYAIGCTSSLVQRGTMSIDDEALLRHIVQTGAEPSGELMERCFPQACVRIGYPRTYQAVAHFWRTVHRNPEEESPVYVVVIRAIVATESVLWVRGTREGTDAPLRVYENIRSLPLSVGDRVYVHGSTVAEEYVD